jgi:hypothetical protein
VAGAVTHVQELPGIGRIDTNDGDEIVVTYNPAVTTAEIIANAFNLQGFPVEIKP